MVAKKQVCVSCGVEWVDGKGWVGEHEALCPNDRYGWRYTIDADEDGNPVHYPGDGVHTTLAYIQEYAKEAAMFAGLPHA